jgi:hypothetical protein
MASEAQLVQKEARDFVIRARLGDQNAKAMLVMIRNSAAAGSKRALYVMRYLKHYIDNHPVVVNAKVGFGGNPAVQRVINAIHSRMHGEPENHAPIMLNAIPRIENPKLAAVPLANCGSLLGQNNPRIKDICASFTEDEKDAFEFGRCNCFATGIHGDVSPKEQVALHMGRAVGIAQRLQAVRSHDDVPVSALSKMAAWELGE